MRPSAHAVASPPQRGGAELDGSTAVRLTIEAFELLRRNPPRVHCLTNAVAQELTANILLAAGAAPSMSIAADEVAHFVRRAGALLVNLGTLDAERRASLPLALDAASQASVPLVLDPVLVDASPPRLGVARDIMRRKPAVIRLNAAEFEALAGAAPGVRSIIGFARKARAVVALTGSTDLISDGKAVFAVRNGHKLMTQVTAMGCAAGALIAALLAVCDDALTASVAGLAALGVAGEIAGERAQGPGSFAVALLDALAGLDAAQLAERARIEILPIEAGAEEAAL
jgi:hydroxyethylthiazole kinase